MNSIRLLICAGIYCLLGGYSYAEEADVTMQIIESLDDIHLHNKISLPNRAVVRETLDIVGDNMQIKQSEHRIFSRDQLNLLSIDEERGGKEVPSVQKR